MKKIIRLTESDIHNLVMEAVNAVLNEAKSIKSKKLQDIFRKYGTPTGGHNMCIDLHNIKDEDIITVLPISDVVNLTSDQKHKIDHGRWVDNFGLDVWAKENGIKTIPGDRIAYVPLGNGDNAVVVINRNESQVSGREGEGWDAYHQKREKRSEDRRLDGQNRYIHKLYDPERFTMWKNPYKKTTWTRDDINGTMDNIRKRRETYKKTGKLTGGLRKMY